MVSDPILREYLNYQKTVSGDMDYGICFDIFMRGAKRMFPWEIEILYKAVMDRKPKVILEIGSWDGCSTMAMGIACKSFGGKVYSIDPRIQCLLSENLKHYDLGEQVISIRGYSPWDGHKIVPEHVNFLFIDGDHSTKSVLMDYYYWVKYLKTRDIVAFHDINFPAVKKAIDLIMESDGRHLSPVKVCRERNRGIGVWQVC